MPGTGRPSLRTVPVQNFAGPSESTVTLLGAAACAARGTAAAPRVARTAAIITRPRRGRHARSRSRRAVLLGTHLRTSSSVDSSSWGRLLRRPEPAPLRLSTKAHGGRSLSASVPLGNSPRPVGDGSTTRCRSCAGGPPARRAARRTLVDVDQLAHPAALGDSARRRHDGLGTWPRPRARV
jgi:hypothetical protein